MQVDENLSHSFQKINVDQHCLDASDNNPSSLVELVNVIDSIFDSVRLALQEGGFFWRHYVLVGLFLFFTD